MQWQLKGSDRCLNYQGTVPTTVGELQDLRVGKHSQLLFALYPSWLQYDTARASSCNVFVRLLGRARLSTVNEPRGQLASALLVNASEVLTHRMSG